MAIPTVLNVLDLARFHLGDDAVSGGAIFTNTLLLNSFGLSYRELYRCLNNLSAPKVRREHYYILPANTNFLDPSTAGISDMGEPEYLEERAAPTTVSISSATQGATGVTIVTGSAHGLTTGQLAVVSGITVATGINGRWGVTVSDGTTFVANGAVMTGTPTLTGAKVGSSSTEFTEMDNVTRIENESISNSALGQWAWVDDTFRFPPASADRQLRITYMASGAAPSSTSASIGIDDSLDFLATRTAGLAAASRGADGRAQTLNAEALGPSGIADGSGGLLRELVNTYVRGLQRQRWVRPPYRDRRELPLVY